MAGAVFRVALLGLALLATAGCAGVMDHCDEALKPPPGIASP